jgi:hypothetical protein
MKYSTWKHLQNLREEKGNEAGKLVQKFLALALLEVGASKLTECAIQGIDIEFELDGCPWAVEVKIVINEERNEIILGAKDFAGLEGRIEKGRKALFAVLGNQLIDEWLFIPHPGSGLQPGKKMPMVLLGVFQDKDWTVRIKGAFEEMVEQNIQVAIEGGQEGLNKVLHSHSDYIIA